MVAKAAIAAAHQATSMQVVGTRGGDGAEEPNQEENEVEEEHALLYSVKGHTIPIGKHGIGAEVFELLMTDDY